MECNEQKIKKKEITEGKIYSPFGNLAERAKRVQNDKSLCRRYTVS